MPALMAARQVDLTGKPAKPATSPPGRASPMPTPQNTVPAARKPPKATSPKPNEASSPPRQVHPPSQHPFDIPRTSHPTPDLSHPHPQGAPTTKGAPSPISKGDASAAPQPKNSTAPPYTSQHHINIPRTSHSTPDLSHPHPPGAPTSKGAAALLTTPIPHCNPHSISGLQIRRPRRLPHPLQRATINNALSTLRCPSRLSLSPAE